MSHILAKKQEEWNSEKVRELLRLPENKKCFDCPTKSPFFVNVSIQTFVCTRCSGLVREVGHRVKSISASKFSGPEIVALQQGGNEVARSIWLSTYNSNTTEPETDGDVRLFMRQKYYEQKWLNRKRGIEHAENVKRIVKELYTEDGTRRLNSNNNKATLGRSGSINRPKIVPTQSWVDDNVPIGLLSPKSPQFPTIPQPSNSTHNITAPTTPTNTPTPNTIPPIATTTTVNNNNDIFSQLADLAPSTPVVKSPSYTGGILQPNSPISPSSSITLQQTLPPSPLLFNNNTTNKSNSVSMDPYAALRDLSIGSKPTPPSPIVSHKSNGISSEDTLGWGDFQKSPTQSSFSNTTLNTNAGAKKTSTIFSDLDPLFKR